MRKLFIAAAVLGLALVARAENANAGVQVSVGIGLPFPGVAYVGPPAYYPPVYYGGPVYYPPAYYGPRYRRVRYYVEGPPVYKRYRRHHRSWDRDW
jgi:hypothetical protein